jgi:hypothetical protein
LARRGARRKRPRRGGCTPADDTRRLLGARDDRARAAGGAAPCSRNHRPALLGLERALRAFGRPSNGMAATALRRAPGRTALTSPFWRAASDRCCGCESSPGASSARWSAHT